MSGGSVDHWLHTPKVIWGAGGVDILFSLCSLATGIHGFAITQAPSVKRKGAA